MTQIEANKQLATLAVDNFALPGDAGFPLNALYQAPQDRSEAGELNLRASCAAEAPSDLVPSFWNLLSEQISSGNTSLTQGRSWSSG